jgi:hypothetical protein
MKTYKRSIRQFATGIGITALMLAMIGCGDDDGTTGTSERGSMVLMMHDAPVDDFREVWVTVESVSMIGADDDSNSSGEVVLTESVRMDLLALDSLAQVVAAVDVEAGEYSKIRLQISDPEFIRDDDSVFSGEDIHLVANGHVDLNTQGDVFIVENAVTVVSLDVDLDNSLQINETGNGRYILRPQIFVDNTMSGEEGIIIDGAVITSIDLNSGEITLTTVETDASVDLIVETTNETTIKTAGGLPLALSALLVGSTVDVVGTIDVETGVITATTVQVALF